MGGGKSGTTIQKTEIPPEVMARYNAVNARAETAAAKPFQKYQGQFVAPLTGTQTSAIQNITQAAGMAQPYYTKAADYTAAGAQNVGKLTADQIAQYQNPYTQSVIDPTMQAMRQQQGQDLAKQQALAIKSGGFGGDRAGIARAVTMGQQDLARAQTEGGLRSQAYQQAVQTAAGQQGIAAADLARQMQAGQQFAGLGTGAQAAALQQAQAQLAGGTLEQQTKQADLTANYQQFLQERGYDFQTAQFLANIAMGTGALSGSTTTTQAPMPFFSDRRLKKDIDMVATTKDGLPVYDFKYKGDDEPHRGYMAQDVEKKYPDAVGLAGGYKTVDYNKVAEHQSEKGLGPAISASSMGGPVHESYGPREHFAAGGPLSQFAPEDWRSLLDMQAKSFGPFAQGGIYGQKPGQTPFQGGLTYVPKGDLAVARLQPHAAPPRMSEGMGAQGVKGIGLLSDATQAVTGRGLGQRLGEKLGIWDPPKAGASDKNAPAGGDANKKVANDAGSPPPASTDAGSSAAARTASIVEDDLSRSFTNTGGVVPSRHHYAGGGVGAMPYASTDQTFDLGAMNAENMKTPQELAKQQKDMSGGAGGAGGQSQTGLGVGETVGIVSNLAKLAMMLPFSDARLKDNIRHVGKTFDGQNIYAYDMGDGDTQLGLMAQEVMRRKPEAVGERDGFLTLDYDKATEDTAMPPKTGGVMPREGLQRGGEPDGRAALMRNLEEEYNLPSGYMSRLYQVESSSGKNLVNPTSSARGHFQFMPDTAREYGVQDPMDFDQSARGAARFSADNMERLRRAGIEQPSGSHLYLAYQQGPGGALKLLQNADRPAADLVGRAAVTGNRGDESMTGSDFANRVMAMYEGQKMPSAGGGLGAGRQAQAQGKAPEGGGVKGFFQENKGVILPILAGLGSMAQSRSPFLGAAILEGIGGGARAYVDMNRELAGTALTEQQTKTQETVTATNLQQIAQNAMFEKNGKRYVMTTNGPMLEGDWIQSALSGNQIPLLGYEQYKQAVEKIGGTPISQQSLSEGRQAAGFADEKVGETKPPKEPMLFGEAGQEKAKENFDTATRGDKEIIAERRAMSAQSEKDLLAQYRTAQASGDRLNQLASMLLKLPDEGVTSTGAMAPQFLAASNFWNDAVRKAPGLTQKMRDALFVDPQDIASKNAAQKITDGMKFALSQGADQRSLGALESAGQAVPRISLDKESNIKILAGLYRDKQRLIDQRTYLSEYKDYMRQKYGPTYGQQYFAQDAIDAFGNDVISTDRYGNEEEAFIKFLRQKKKDGSSAALDVIQGKPVNRQYLDQAFREYYNAPHLRRYFENR
jgi:hypothetical protein